MILLTYSGLDCWKSIIKIYFEEVISLANKYLSISVDYRIGVKYFYYYFNPFSPRENNFSV